MSASMTSLRWTTDTRISRAYVPAPAPVPDREAAGRMTEISRGPVLKPEACQPPDLEQHRCRKRNEKPAADTRDHSRLLGLLSGFVTRPMPGLEVPPVESPVESFARLVLFHLASKSALQRMMTAAVMAHWVSLHPVSAVTTMGHHF
ncbi:hypothetical protein HPB51_016195 [Rhipicephalus microplus]|uniref:Mot1 central domain-containing protein n=1 Tax=Rhipicephalus microplus TaxID=6941 RepID=A0A9J6E216_RHIMP|nr:hypothetical protein HPB51_016195 [Rhipicephalus microplus]